MKGNRNSSPSEAGGMKAMIFAAGLGTRLKPWTDRHPKALVPVNGKSLLQRNIEYLQQFNITDIIINVHHFADQVLEAVKKNNGWGSRITVSDERDELLDTGGGLMKAKYFFTDNRPFVTLNADMLTNLDLVKMTDYHLHRKCFITLAVMHRKTSRYFLFDNSDRLCGWMNTRTGEEKIAIAGTGLGPKAYSGVAIFQPEIFSVIPHKGKFSLTEAFIELAPEQMILGFDHTGDKWIDVGKPGSVSLAETLFA